MSLWEFMAQTGFIMFTKITQLDIAGRKVSANQKLKSEPILCYPREAQCLRSECPSHVGHALSFPLWLLKSFRPSKLLRNFVPQTSFFSEVLQPFPPNVVSSLGCSLIWWFRTHPVHWCSQSAGTWRQVATPHLVPHPPQGYNVLSISGVDRG